MSFNFENLILGLMLLGALTVGVIWGCWELVDYLWIDDVIKVTKPLKPELEIFIRDNIVDTLYVYRLK
ncbi:MAG: hypothetical protein ACRCX2_09745 [Paraclostridium sp.]